MGFTDGETPEEVEENARDAVRCDFDDEAMPKLIRLHFVRDHVIAV